MAFAKINLMTVSNLLQGFKTIQLDPSFLFEDAAFALLPEVRKRVHTDGKDADGNQIGTYSPGYMKVRTGNYKDAAKYKRGDKAGQFKKKKSEAKGEAGRISRGPNRGQNRRAYNRTGDPKVILSLTRQMENGLTVLKSPKGYGLGYLNPYDYQKALWCEETYQKPILSEATTEELQLVASAAEQSLIKFLNT